MSFRNFTEFRSLILEHPLPFLTMKANSRSPRHDEKLKSDDYQACERLLELFISCIWGSCPPPCIPQWILFHKLKTFFLSSRHSGVLSLRSHCLPLYHLFWSSFYDPHLLVLILSTSAHLVSVFFLFQTLMTAELPCAVLGTTLISTPSALY